jgi:hypothetical protein
MFEKKKNWIFPLLSRNYRTISAFINFAPCRKKFLGFSPLCPEKAHTKAENKKCTLTPNKF